VTLLAVGRLKARWAFDGSSEYIERIRKQVQLTVEELPASKEKDPDKQREEECARILDRLGKLDGDVWVLDERGKGMTSEQLSAVVRSSFDIGRPLVFVLGGAYGLTEEVRKKGKLLRLSDMTLPHELCRVLFLEQFYRALEIQKGSGYHHE